MTKHIPTNFYGSKPWYYVTSKGYSITLDENLLPPYQIVNADTLDMVCALIDDNLTNKIKRTLTATQHLLKFYCMPKLLMPNDFYMENQTFDWSIKYDGMDHMNACNVHISTTKDNILLILNEKFSLA